MKQHLAASCIDLGTAQEENHTRFLGPEGREENLRRLRSLKARAIYIPCMYVPAGDKHLLDGIENLHLVDYDTAESRSTFDPYRNPSSKRFPFCDPEWVLRHVTKVERIESAGELAE